MKDLRVILIGGMMELIVIKTCIGLTDRNRLMRQLGKKTGENVSLRKESEKNVWEAIHS